jgi:hypothetical protein
LPVTYFLHTAAAPPTADELDGRIEAWLRHAFGAEIDFAVNGALGKLEELGLLRRQQERLFVSPLDGALAQLQAVWGKFLAPERALLLLRMSRVAKPKWIGWRWNQSGNFVITAVLGGMRSFWGPLIGAAIFLVLQDYVSSHTQNWMSFIGLFFVLIVLFFPRGVLGIIRRKATT